MRSLRVFTRPNHLGAYVGCNSIFALYVHLPCSSDTRAKSNSIGESGARMLDAVEVEHLCRIPTFMRDHIFI